MSVVLALAVPHWLGRSPGSHSPAHLSAASSCLRLTRREGQAGKCCARVFSSAASKQSISWLPEWSMQPRPSNPGTPQRRLQWTCCRLVLIVLCSILHVAVLCRRQMVSQVFAGQCMPRQLTGQSTQAVP